MYGRHNPPDRTRFYGDTLSEAEVIARGLEKEELYRKLLAGGLETILVPGIRPFLDRHRDLPMAVGTNAQPEKR